MRAVSPIQVMVLPYQLRFLPALSSRIAVLSSMGQVQLVDTAALSAPQISIFQVAMPMEGCSTLSMDISPSNQCLAFGDSTNSLHLYSSVPDPVLNPFARDTEFADQVEQLPPMDIDDPLAIYSSIPRPNLPPGQNQYASDYWPDRFNKPVFRPTPEIDAEILRTMKVVGTIGYARNVTNAKRNQVRYPNVKTKESRERDGHERGMDKEGSAEQTNVPKAYRKVAIKLSKLGSDDFDFDRYNRTGFCGLEASLPNSYCNAMLQILYYTEKLRILMLNHTCERENCVCCELSFLFHMMDISPGMPCHSGNFLRAMRTIPEASALGLVFSDQNAIWKTNVPRLIQSWNRFILHQISIQLANARDSNPDSSLARLSRGGLLTNKESPESDVSESSPQPMVGHEDLFQAMFGMKQEKVNVCTKCKISSSTDDVVLLCNLVYPETKEKTQFEQVLCSSLSPEQTTPAWCEKCRKYQPTHQRRNLRSLPNMLSLNAGMDNVQDIEFWQQQMEHVYEMHKPATAVAEESEVKATPSAPPPNAKPCRYGLSCNRPDCKFWHPEMDQSTAETIDVGDKLWRMKKSWVPQQLHLKLMDTGKVVNVDEEGTYEEGEESSRRRYQL